MALSQTILSLLLLTVFVTVTRTGCKDSAALSNLTEIDVCIEKLQRLRGRLG